MVDSWASFTAKFKWWLTSYLNIPFIVALVLVVLAILNLDRKVRSPKQITILCDKINAKNFSGEVLDFYENGQILTLANVRMGNILGHATVWRKNGKLKSYRMYYSKGRKVIVKKWHENGQLEESYLASRAVHKKRAFYPYGLYQAWYSNGQLKHSASYNMGKLGRQPLRSKLKKVPIGFWRKDGKKLKNSSIPNILPSIPIVPRIWYELGAKDISCGIKRKKRRRKK